VRLPATYPLGYASVAPLPAALLDGLFEQPPKNHSGECQTRARSRASLRRTAHGKRAVRQLGVGWV